MSLMTLSQLKMALKYMEEEVTTERIRSYFEITTKQDSEKINFHIQNAIKFGYLTRVRKEGTRSIYANNILKNE